MYPFGYTSTPIEVRATPRFSRWIDALSDSKARGRILARIRRMSEGNFGDVKNVGDGVMELRVHYAAGYRLYCTRIGATVVVLLAGGDKRSQRKDIDTARSLAREL